MIASLPMDSAQVLWQHLTKYCVDHFINQVTYGVRDVHVFAANLSSPTYQTKGPTWEPYYSAKAAYGSLLTPPITEPHAELTPAVWSQIIDLSVPMIQSSSNISTASSADGSTQLVKELARWIRSVSWEVRRVSSRVCKPVQR